MCAGIVMNTAGNVALVQASAAGTFERGSFVDTLYVASALLLGAATWWPMPARSARARDDRTRTLLAPSLFSLCSLAVLLGAAIAPGTVGPVAAAFATATIVALMVRSTVAVRESRALLAASRE